MSVLQITSKKISFIGFFYIFKGFSTALSIENFTTYLHIVLDTKVVFRYLYLPML